MRIDDAERMQPDELQLARRSDLFRNISEDALAQILERCPVMDLAPGEVLLTPHEKNECVYLVLRGRLHIYLDQDSLPPYLSLQAGECVGEMSIIDGMGASALVIASTAARLLRIEQETLWALVNASHDAARNLLYILSIRMRQGNANLALSLRNQRDAERAAMVDGLTGLNNRRWLDQAFPRQIERCLKAGRPASLLLVDVDHFKRVNDDYGHPAGDRALAQVADLLSQQLRPGDMLARYGGEEFAALLPDAGAQDALTAAQRLRAAAEATRIDLGEGKSLGLTLSIGVADTHRHGTLEALVGAADKALYEAKRAGRNRVRVAPAG